jgi:arabinogalactan oligomer/maltooligosaccharide transport system permease protein
MFMAQNAVIMKKRPIYDTPAFLSVFFMGLGQILRQKQYIKGLFFALTEIIFLVNANRFYTVIKNLITLGEDKSHLPITQRDNSIFMLVEGIVFAILLIGFIALYIANIRDAIKTEEHFARTGSYPGVRAFMSSLADTSFAAVGLSPVIVMLTFFVIVPLLFSVLIAFTNYSSPNNIPPAKTVDWVGFQTFQEMSSLTTWKSAFLRTAAWTLTWAALSTATCYIGGMAMALALLSKKIKLPKLFRSVYVLPYAVPAMLSLMVWANLLNGQFGPINRLLREWGFITDNILWLSDALLAKISVISVNLWLGFPYFMMLTTGVMTSVSPDLYEAASIDGANPRVQFTRITLPLVLYQTIPLMIMSFSHNLNNFGAVYFLTRGNPADTLTTQSGAGSLDILMSWMYKLTYDLRLYNKAAVVAILIFIVIAPFAIYNFSRTKAFKEGEV